MAEAEWEEFCKGLTNASFAIALEDFLREQFAKATTRELKLYCKTSQQRRCVHRVAEHLGLSHVKAEKLYFENGSERDYGSLTETERAQARASGYIAVAANGCVPECCGWAVVKLRTVMTVARTGKENLHGRTIRDVLGLKASAAQHAVKQKKKKLGCWDIPVLLSERPLPAAINTDTLVSVYQFLGVVDACRAAQVCRSWNKFINSSATLWKLLFYKTIQSEPGAPKDGHVVQQGSAAFWKAQCKEASTGLPAFCRDCKGMIRHVHISK